MALAIARSPKRPLFTVARGPVPRDLSRTENARSPVARGKTWPPQSMHAQHRTAPYGNGRVAWRGKTRRARSQTAPLHRSARSCASRSLSHRERPQPHSARENMALAIGARRGTGPRSTGTEGSRGDRETARDRPSPYGLRSIFTVARGPGERVPKRPLFTVARGPSRRNFVISAAPLQRCPLSLAISRPPRKPFFTRAKHGAAQDRALRTKAPLHRSARACASRSLSHRERPQPRSARAPLANRFLCIFFAF